MASIPSDPVEPQARNLTWAFILTVSIGVLPSIVHSLIELGDVLSAARLFLLSVIFLLIGLIAEGWVARLNRTWAFYPYFLIIMLVAAIAVYSAPNTGALWLIPMPIIAQALMIDGWRGVLFVAGLTLAVFMVPTAFQYGWLDAILFGLSLLSAIVFVTIFTQIFINERLVRAEAQRLAEELSQANDQLRRYSLQAEELATITERNRLAREIHDSVGHALTVANVQLEAARVVFDSEPEKARQALGKAQQMAREGLSALRQSVAALRASPLESQALPQALQALIEETGAAGLVVDLQLEGDLASLSGAFSHALYRSTQEALTNVRKHARASRVDVHLSAIDDRIRLMIQDNGVGAESETPASGFGLLGLRERVEALGGQTKVHSRPGHGYRLEVELPR